MTRKTIAAISLGALAPFAAASCVLDDFDDGEAWPEVDDLAAFDESVADAIDSLPPSTVAVAYHCEGTLHSVECTNETDSDHAHQIIGGQDVNVRLAASNFDVDPDPVSSWTTSGTFTFDVTVENLLDRAMGDEAEGVSVFFVDEPAVTEGDTGGNVSIELVGTQTGTFTRSGQQFYQYAGPIEPGATPEAVEWRLDFSGIEEGDAEDIRYRFSVLLSASLVDHDVVLTFETSETDVLSLEIEMGTGFENTASWRFHDAEGKLTATYDNVDEVDHDFEGEVGDKVFLVFLEDRAGPRQIRWPSRSLVGELPPDIGLLTNLEEISFFQNDFTGGIPEEWGQLENLTLLQLARNDLDQPLPPQIGGMTSLE